MELKKAKMNLLINEVEKQITETKENGGNVYEIAMTEIGKMREKLNKI